MKKHYSLLRLAAAVLASTALWPQASALELESGKLYGFVSATGYWAMTANNFYTFDKANPSAGTKLGNTTSVSYKPDIAGVFLDNGEFIGVGKQSSYSTTKMVMRLSLGSDDNWTASKSEAASFSNVASMTNDNGTIYMWYQASLGASWTLATLDPETFAVTAVSATGSSTKMIAMAAGGDALYGIATDGNLYTISKEDGSATKVGSTGMTAVDKPQSACYDSESGAVLWARYDDSSMFNKKSEIVSVDPATGKGSSGGTLTNTPQVLGLYTPVSVSADAPGEVTDLAAVNEGTDNNITVTFTMPTKNYGGKDFNPNLQGLSYTISVDGQVVVDKKASGIGEQVSETVESTPGTHTVSVFASQTVFGDGPEVKTSVFVGMDTPGAPKNVKATAVDSDVTVTWEAPEGQNGGKYDAAKLAYKLVRMPGEVTVAENLTEPTFTETIDTDKLAAYTYTVTTVYDGTEGLSTESASVFAGPSFEVTRETPYFQDFQSCTTAAESGFFLAGKSPSTMYTDPVLNILTENETNKYLQVTPDASYSRVNNPKVFTTALKLRARHTYKLSMKFRTSNAYGASFSVYLSDKPTEDCQNLKTIIAEKSYGYPDDNAKEFTDDRVTPTEFQVDETGVYFVSVQHGFLAATWDFDDVKVEDITEPGVPATPTDLTAEVAEGSREVKLSFVLPTEDNNGDDPQLTAVEIKRDDATVATLTEELAAGKAMTWTDENAPLGNHTYTVVATNANGSSAPAQTAVKVGRDYDLAVTQIEAPESVVKGRKFTVSATVHNNGINSAALGEDEYTIALVRNLEGGATEVVATRTGELLESDKDAVFQFELTVPAYAGNELSYYFYLTYELDQNADNNRSADFTVGVVTPEFPAPTALEARWNDGKYDLTWAAPEYDADVVTLAGYDIYCNDVKVNGDTPVAETAYTAEGEPDVEYVFYVVAVYDLGSSEASNKVTAYTSGIDAVESAGFAVSTCGTTLSVSGANGPVAVYSVAGVCVARKESCGETVAFELARGAYVVTAGGHTVKISL